MPSIPAASRNETPCDRCMKSITSPDAPQPKQWNRRPPEKIVNDGERSLWNGQQALYSFPARMSFTPDDAATEGKG